MASRILALLIWAAVAASVAYWGLRWLAKPTAVPPIATSVSLDNAARGDLRKLLVGPVVVEAAAPEQSMAAMLANRIKLLGVVAPRVEGQGGVALLSVDGKPPRAVRAGAAVDGNLVLLNVNQRGVQIGPASGPAQVSLDLPMLPAAATGSLPPPTGIEGLPGQPGMPPGAQPGMPPGMPPGGASSMSYAPSDGSTASMSTPPEGLPPPAAGNNAAGMQQAPRPASRRPPM